MYSGVLAIKPTKARSEVITGICSRSALVLPAHPRAVSWTTAPSTVWFARFGTTNNWLFETCSVKGVPTATLAPGRAPE